VRATGSDLPALSWRSDAEKRRGGAEWVDGVRWESRPDGRCARAGTAGGAGELDCGSEESAHGARICQSGLALSFRHGDRGYAERFRPQWRAADAPGTARLAGR